MPHGAEDTGRGPSADFASLGLAEALVAPRPLSGTKSPRPSSARPFRPARREGRARAGRDGTGKTAAFALPMLQRITQEGCPRPHECPHPGPHPRAGDAGRGGDPQVLARARPQGRAPLRRRGDGPADPRPEAGADVVVATPGRALDHIRRRTLKLDQVRVLVLDEADEMLDMGFAEDIEAILDTTLRSGRRRSSRPRCLHASPPSRSATCATRRASRSSARRWRRGRSPACDRWPSSSRVRTSPWRWAGARHGEPHLGDRLLPHAPRGRRAGRDAERHGYRAEALHGGMVQKQRDRVMAQFARRRRTCWSPPTSPPAASTSRTSRTSSTTTSLLARGLRAPDRPHGPQRRAGVASPWPSRASTANSGTSRRSRARRSSSRRSRPWPTFARAGST